jgi:hypothetical protein
MTLAAIIETLASHGNAVLIFAVSLVALIPTPGLPVGTVFGTILTLLALQEMIGVRRARLPGRLGRYSLPRPQVRRVTRRLTPVLLRLERWSRPRLPALTRGWLLPVLAFIIALQGILIALPIPFGNTAPGLAAALMALAWITRDGLAVLGGLLLAAGWLGLLGALATGALNLAATI